MMQSGPRHGRRGPLGCRWPGRARLSATRVQEVTTACRAWYFSSPNFGFLLLLWLFVYAVIRTIRADIATAGGSRIIRRDRRARGDHAKGSARYLVVTAHGRSPSARSPC